MRKVAVVATVASVALRVATMATSTTANAATEEEAKYWDERWKSGVKPKSMWDIGKTEDCLVRALEWMEENPDITKALAGKREKTAFVPGCGRGYAVVTLAERGYQALGLDISPNSVAEAEANARATFKPSQAQAEAVPRFTLGDFFVPETYNAPAKGYDLVFDSTFLCAIPTSRREEWALTMRRILAPDTGVLVMNVYPLYPTLDVVDPIKSARDGPFYDGPPYRLSESHIKTLLEPLGFRLVLDEPTPLDKMERKRELMGHASREGLMVWLAPRSGDRQAQEL